MKKYILKSLLVLFISNVSFAQTTATDFTTNDVILNQIFISSLTYKVQDKYSDTVNLENTSVENLLDKTYQELLTVLAQNIITK